MANAQEPQIPRAPEQENIRQLLAPVAGPADPQPPQPQDVPPVVDQAGRVQDVPAQEVIVCLVLSFL